MRLYILTFSPYIVIALSFLLVATVAAVCLGQPIETSHKYGVSVGQAACCAHSASVASWDTKRCSCNVFTAPPRLAARFAMRR